MLGKLFRYDSKVQIKFLAGCSLVALLFSLVSIALYGLCKLFSGLIVLQILGSLAKVLCIAAAVMLIVGNFIYAVLYFRRNLFRDEGYLMHTLPVTGTQLFFSKLLTGTLIVYAAGVLAFVCVSIGIPSFRKDFLEVMRQFFFMLEQSGTGGETVVVFMTVVSILLSIPLSLCQCYACLTVGYTWKFTSDSHLNRDLLSILAYIVLYLAQQLISTFVLVIYMVFRFGDVFGTWDFSQHFEAWGAEYETAFLGYIRGFMCLALVIMTVVGIVLTLFSVRRLNRHVNLE